MAQTTSRIPQYHQCCTAHQQPESAFLVVDQRPCQREVFPYRLQVNWIFGFSIVKCIIGSLLFLAGIANVVIVRYDIHIGIGIWCGLTILANGIIGCILKCKQNKCLVGAFLGLSITSLIFDVAMLSFSAVVLDYFVHLRHRYCYYDYYRRSTICHGVKSDVKDQGIGITSFLMFMALCELACSIGSVVVSCKAYSKCCNTSDCNDCCTCVGCCESDCHPLNLHQDSQPMYSPSYNHQNIQNPNQPLLNTNVQAPSIYNAQPAPTSPCSGLVNFIVNMPAYLFGGPSGTELSAINFTVQPVRSSHQGPTNEQARGAEQVEGAFVGSMRYVPPMST